MTTSHWALGGGVSHDVAQVRRDSYSKLLGAEGVCAPGDLRVRQTPTAGGNVRVTIGSAYMTSRYPGAVRESYMGTVVEQEIIAIPPNNGSSTRRDLIAMRVRDPFVQGSPWSDPGASLDPEEAEAARDAYAYVQVFRVPSVAASVTKLQQVPGYENDTGVALGRVALPAGQSQVLDSHITDLRQVHTPWSDGATFARPRVDSDGDIYLTALNSAGGELFPGGGSGSPNSFTVDIPEQATRMTLDAAWISVIYDGSKNPRGAYWMEYGDEYKPHTWPNKQQYEFATQKFSFNSPATADELTSGWRLMDEVPVPAKLRGKTVTFAFKAGRNDAVTSANNKAVRMAGSGGLGCVIKFAQRAIDDHLL